MSITSLSSSQVPENDRTFWNALGASNEWGPEDRFLETFQSNSPTLLDAKEEFLQSLHQIRYEVREDSDLSEQESRKKVADLTAVLIETIQRSMGEGKSLPNRDYSRIVAACTDIRSGFSDGYNLHEFRKIRNQGCSPVTDQVLDYLTQIYKLSMPYATIEPGERNKFEKGFAQDVLLLLRSTYTYGVNMKTPDWKEDCAFYSASEQIRMTMNTSLGKTPDQEINGKIVPGIKMAHLSVLQIVPKGEDSSYVIHGGKLLGIIGEGESLIVGRRMKLNSLFGLERGDGKPLVNIENRGEGENMIDETRFSRAGFLVLRFNGGIYLFHRGAKNTGLIVIEGADEKGPMKTEFSEISVESDDMLSFGKSVSAYLDPNESDEI